jgi:replicative DNA helicase
MSRTPSTGRLPPHDLDAEQGALGAAMLSAQARGTVLGHLGEEDFYRPAHRTIYRAIRELHTCGRPVDALTVAAELGRVGVLAEVGGAPFLTPWSLTPQPPPTPAPTPRQ